MYNDPDPAKRVMFMQDVLERDPERTRFETRIEEIIDYCRPDLSGNTRRKGQERGEERGDKMYTSKPFTDLLTASDAFVGNVFSEGWFGYATDSKTVNLQNDAQKWFEDLKDHFSAVYAEYGFYDTLPPIAADAMSVGDGFLCISDEEEELGTNIEEGRKRVETFPYFEYCEILSIWFLRDRHNQLATVHRRHSYTAYKAYQRWGDKCSDQLQRMAKEKPTEIFDFIQAIYKKGDPVLEGLKVDKDREYIEFWVEEDYVNRNNKSGDGSLVEQSGYRVMPYMDWPYWLKSTESIGRGPLGLGIRSVKRLHAEHKTIMTKGQREAAPPLIGPMGLQHTINRNADGYTGIKPGMTGGAPQELYSSRGAPHAVDYLERNEDEIEGILNLPFFLMIANTTKRMTIPEMAEKTGERASVMAPRLGLMDRLLLKNVHKKTWSIESKNGRIPPMPESVAAYFKEKLDQGYKPDMVTRYKGPISVAHDQLFTQRRVAATLATAQPIVAFDPQVAKHKINVDKALEHVLDSGGFWQDSINDSEEVEKRVDLENQLIQAQAKIEALETQSRTNVNNAKAAQE